MKKSISAIIELIIYIVLFCIIAFKYLFLDKQPSLIECLLLIILSISIESREIKEQIKNLKK